MHHSSTKWATVLLGLRSGLEGGAFTSFPDDTRISSSWRQRHQPAYLLSTGTTGAEEVPRRGPFSISHHHRPGRAAVWASSRTHRQPALGGEAERV